MPNVAAAITDQKSTLIEKFNAVRAYSEQLCQPLETEDYVIQSIEDVSPPRWHLAHTTWFFEQVVLEQFAKNYIPYHADYYFLFNSYYNTFGQRVMRTHRGTLSRPTVLEIYEYRNEVNLRMRKLIEEIDSKQFARMASLVELGLNHEQQHQELTLTDIKWNLGANPLYPVYRKLPVSSDKQSANPPRFITIKGSVFSAGHSSSEFSFDNETPKHDALVADFKLMDRLVTCGEFLRFVNDGGYQNPSLWLDDGWSIVTEQGWKYPHYWIKKDSNWLIYTLGGLRSFNDCEPVCHVSYFEAAAYARWAGKRLPTEYEWERAAQLIEDKISEGNFADNDTLHPVAADKNSEGLKQMFGDVWEWTNSAYLPYPGYLQAQGALGEYNGKFMSGQMVCRGGSCATSRNHFRITYRNFFQPDKRWQFLGFRLASDI